MSKRRKILFILVAPLTVIIMSVMLNYFFMSNSISTQPTVKTTPTVDTKEIPAEVSQPEAVQAYEGKNVTISNGFMVSVPNNWRASVSTQVSFLGIQFARPGKLESLVYNAAIQPVIDYDGIPSWGGLTDHFYIRRITSPSQAFSPADHAEVTSQPFTFKDGVVGTKYSVTKHATEAQKYGGLLKDSEWYGRVFVYTKGDTTVEAHLAYYPSTKIEPGFYEKVASSIEIGE